MGKRLELLREAVPGLSRVAILSQATNPGNVEYLRQAELGASALGLQVQVISIRDAGDFERAFAEMRSVGAAIQLEDVLFTSYRKQMVELAARNRLPIIYGERGVVDDGGLMAYGPDLPGLYRLVATYVDKILNGAKPADLPVQQPTKFELVINRKPPNRSAWQSRNQSWFALTKLSNEAVQAGGFMRIRSRRRAECHRHARRMLSGCRNWWEWPVLSRGAVDRGLTLTRIIATARKCAIIMNLLRPPDYNEPFAPSDCSRGDAPTHSRED